jgi:hypothetical protein
LEALAHIPVLGEAMLLAAQNADWEEVQRLDDERYALLATLDLDTLMKGGETARTVLEEALQITEILLKLAREARADHSDELGAVQRGQRGARAYLSSEG